jgi:KUP system potassium uptake protein
LLPNAPPYVTEVERATLEDLGKGIARVIVRFGFTERPALPPVLERYREQIGIDVNETSFFLGRETPVPSIHPPLALWREKLFAFMARNAVSAADYFQIPPKRVVELGTQVEL